MLLAKGMDILVDYTDKNGEHRLRYIPEDEDGLPDINDKEADAIAAYIAYTIKYKEALKTHN